MEEDYADRLMNAKIIDVVTSTSDSLGLFVESPYRPLYFAMEEFCNKGTAN
jgi:hypothetical protein